MTNPVLGKENIIKYKGDGEKNILEAIKLLESTFNQEEDRA